MSAPILYEGRVLWCAPFALHRCKITGRAIWDERTMNFALVWGGAN